MAPLVYLKKNIVRFRERSSGINVQDMITHWLLRFIPFRSFTKGLLWLIASFTRRRSSGLSIAIANRLTREASIFSFRLLDTYIKQSPFSYYWASRVTAIDIKNSLIIFILQQYPFRCLRAPASRIRMSSDKLKVKCVFFKNRKRRSNNLSVFDRKEQLEAIERKTYIKNKLLTTQRQRMNAAIVK